MSLMSPHEFGVSCYDCQRTLCAFSLFLLMKEDIITTDGQQSIALFMSSLSQNSKALISIHKGTNSKKSISCFLVNFQTIQKCTVM